MSWWSDTFETTPPPGHCDGGTFTECCTDAQGRTTCSSTLPLWFVPGLSGVWNAAQGAFGEHGTEVRPYPFAAFFDEDTPDDPALAYVQAKGRGYTGTPEDFAEQWAKYQAEKNRPGWLDRQVDDAVDEAAKSVWDKLPDLNTILLFGGAAGALWFYRKPLRKAIRRRGK